uniref:Uncharacterized protein n=1 Tax=Anguilla anguilla TaxID=7936 RepID=A0A0E9T054_ANGAN
MSLNYICLKLNFKLIFKAIRNRLSTLKCACQHGYYENSWLFYLLKYYLLVLLTADFFLTQEMLC